MRIALFFTMLICVAVIATVLDQSWLAFVGGLVAAQILVTLETKE